MDECYSTRDELWRFMPGSNTIDLIRMDKSDMNPRQKIARYIGEPMRDLGKLAICAGAVFGFYKLIF